MRSAAEDDSSRAEHNLSWLSDRVNMAGCDQKLDQKAATKTLMEVHQRKISPTQSNENRCSNILDCWSSSTIEAGDDEIKFGHTSAEVKYQKPMGKYHNCTCQEMMKSKFAIWSKGTIEC